MFRPVLLFFFCWIPTLSASAQVWDSLGKGVNAPIYTLHLEVASNTLWAGGAFTQAGSNGGGFLSIWRNGSWQVEGNPNDTVRSIIEVDNVPFVGGDFTQIGGVNTNGFGQLFNGAWQPLGSSIDNGEVTDLQIYDNGVAVGGTFQSINGQSFKHIGLWTINGWQPLGAGLNGPVTTMAALNDELYVAGDFTQAGGIGVEGIAKWNGAQWVAVPGATFGTSGGAIHSLEVWFGRLYAGGCFDSINTKAAHNIALFDGLQWFPLGDGTNGCVYAMEGLPDLYVGGDFSAAGGKNRLRLAKWTGSAWGDAGGDFDGPVLALDGSNSQLFVAGDFSTVTSDKGQYPVNHIARLDFTTGIDNPANNTALRLFPNPASDQVFISTPPTLAQFTILLTDMAGRTVKQHQVNQPGTANVSVTDLPNGMYLLHVLEDNIRQASGRLVIAR